MIAKKTPHQQECIANPIRMEDASGKYTIQRNSTDQLLHYEFKVWLSSNGNDSILQGNLSLAFDGEVDCDLRIRLMAIPPAAAVLFTQLAEPLTGEAIFDGMPDVVYFVKNLRGEYVVVNETLVSRSASRLKRDLIGLTAAEVFPPPLGQLYHEQDLSLLMTGKPLVNQLELHLYSSGATGWCLTTKHPLHDRRGRVIGLVGVSRDLQTPADVASGMDQIAAAVRYLQAHLDRPLKIRDLANIAGLSAYQLDQRCRKVFHLTIGQLMTKLRMDAAALRLRETDDPLGSIAHDCGYADQSAFTRQFRRTTGLTPAVYRRSQRESR